MLKLSGTSWVGVAILGPPALVAAWTSESLRRARALRLGCSLRVLREVRTPCFAAKLKVTLLTLKSATREFPEGLARGAGASVVVAEGSTPEALERGVVEELSSLAGGWEPRSEVAAAAARGDLEALSSRSEVDTASLHFAVLWNRLSALELLLKRGADPNAERLHGYTPLHWAAEVGQQRTIQLLIKGGAAVNARGEQGQTPLHRAALAGQHRAARLLLLHSADPDARDEEGKTPLHYAVEAENPRIVELLVRAGADPYAEDGRGGTPYGLADLNLRLVIERALRLKRPADRLRQSG